MSIKRCGCCKLTIDITLFSKDKSQCDGHSRRCKICVNKNEILNKEKIKSQKRDYYYRNRELQIVKSRENYKRNKEAYKVLAKTWYENNKERHNLKMNAWRKDNLDRAKQLGKIHYINNKYKYREKDVKRRLIQKQAIPAWANKKKIREIYKNCPKGYHVDHIVPLNSDFVCGFHVEHNLQYLTASENSKKHNSVEHLKLVKKCL